MHMEEGSHHSNLGIISRYCDESGKALDWFVQGCPDMYIASESYEEVPEDDRAHYLCPYFYPMLDEYDYTQEDMPLLPDVGGLRQPGHGYGRQPEDGRAAGAGCATTRRVSSSSRPTTVP